MILIRLPGNIKMCGINDYFLINQAYVDSTFQEHIKYFIFKSLQGCTDFKNTVNPIRVASALSMIKRIVTPGSQVFKSTYPLGVMAVEQTDNEELGALISPQNKAMKNRYIPQELTTMPILKRMKNIGIKDNVDIRIGYESVVYNVGYVHYDVSRQKTFDTKRKWDFKMEPGRFYTEHIRMSSIIPKEFIYKFCMYSGVEYNLKWFVEFMNTNGNSRVRFELGVDPGTKLNEVFIYYPLEILLRATSTTPPEIEEEGDVDRHWTISRSFLLSMNCPTVLYFGRERDANLPEYIPTISDPLEELVRDGALDDSRKGTTTIPKENIATVEQTVQFSTVTDYPGYQHIASYDFSEDELRYLKEEALSRFDVTIFDNILKKDLEESIFYSYCKDLKILERVVNPPIKIVFKINNVIKEYPILDINDSFRYTVDNVQEIVSVGKFTIFIYFDTNTYRDFLMTKDEREIVINTVTIEQV